MKTLLVISLLVFPLSLSAQGAYDHLSLEDKQTVMQEHYSRAIRSYNDENFSRAIYHWKEILKIDPSQTAPPTMIEEAQRKLGDQITPLKETLEGAIQSGKYALASETASTLADRDPANDYFQDTRKKLTAITGITETVTDSDRTSRFIRRALYAHLAKNPYPKFALNAIWHARDINPKHPEVAPLVAHLEETYPALANSEQVTPGMAVVDHKLFIALQHIYDGRYDLSIFACDEVLQLEPTNILALKRKGSAIGPLTKSPRPEPSGAMP